ncbi:MAG: UDP-N-acetylmuramoyl-tripeptide--D-alanyl-D-alanine ligase [Phormidesmis sp.]
MAIIYQTTRTTQTAWDKKMTDGFATSLATLGSVLGATPRALPDKDSPETVATGITTDTRAVNPGDIFLALEGERLDGHDFVEKAIEKGAIAVIVRKGVFSSTSPFPRLEVDDTLTAYQTLGQWWRRQRAMPVVAITGSAGKTTTKELVAAALSVFCTESGAGSGAVHKTQANYNNEIGVPKTLLGLKANHDYAVVEMGMRGLEEIALLSRIAEPTVGLITNVGTAHIGRLGSREAIAQAKCELLREMPPGGIAVLNHDNDLLLSTAAKVWSGQQITYGLTGGDVQGQFKGDHVLVNGVHIPLPLPGQHNALNLLGAIATLQALDLDWKKLADGISVSLPSGRSQTHHLPNDIVLLDETYNAGAEAMSAALQLLADQPGTRRIAVLGTMKELGEQSIALHREIGEIVNRLGLDYLLILADPDEAMAMAAGAGATPSQQFTSHDELVTHLEQTMKKGDRILFKASRSVGMDQVVNRLLQNS